MTARKLQRKGGKYVIGEETTIGQKRKSAAGSCVIAAAPFTCALFPWVLVLQQFA